MFAYDTHPIPSWTRYTGGLTLENTKNWEGVDVAMVAYVGSLDSNGLRKLLLATSRHGGQELVVSSDELSDLLVGTRCNDVSELQGRYPLTTYFAESGIVGLGVNAHISLWAGVLQNRFGWDTCVDIERRDPGKSKPWC
jgi:hypothetical protein